MGQTAEYNPEFKCVCGGEGRGNHQGGNFVTSEGRVMMYCMGCLRAMSRKKEDLSDPRLATAREWTEMMAQPTFGQVAESIERMHCERGHWG
jgi:hypothetical protein